jgi:D-amino-acid dehydrogenase
MKVESRVDTPISDARNAASPLVIVGGGLIGLNCAFHLRHLGTEIVVVDPADLRAAASYGNAGQIASGEVVPIAGPGVLRAVPGWLMDPLGPLAIRWQYLPRLTPWLIRFLRAGQPHRVAAISRSMAALCARMHDDFQPVLAAAGATDLLRPGPLLQLYDSRQHWESQGWRWQLRIDAGTRHALLNHAALHSAEPALSDVAGFAVAYADRSFIADPGDLMLALKARLIRDGVRFINSTIQSFDRSGNAVTALILADGTRCRASAAVIAAGAWSGSLAARLGDRVPLETERGYHAVLPRPGITLHHALSHVRRGFALMPMRQGLRLAGTVEFAGLVAAPRWHRARRLIEGARALLPGLCADDAQFWMGHRPSLPDSLPVISRASTVRNVVYAFGHGHMGLSWSATTGRLVASLFDGTTPPVDLAPFQVSRFAARGRARP